MGFIDFHLLVRSRESHVSIKHAVIVEYVLRDEYESLQSGSVSETSKTTRKKFQLYRLK